MPVCSRHPGSSPLPFITGKIKPEMTMNRMPSSRPAIETRQPANDGGHRHRLSLTLGSRCPSSQKPKTRRGNIGAKIGGLPWGAQPAISSGERCARSPRRSVAKEAHDGAEQQETAGAYDQPTRASKVVMRPTALDVRLAHKQAMGHHRSNADRRQGQGPWPMAIATTPSQTPGPQHADRGADQHHLTHPHPHRAATPASGSAVPKPEVEAAGSGGRRGRFSMMVVVVMIMVVMRMIVIMMMVVVNRHASCSRPVSPAVARPPQGR